MLVLLSQPPSGGCVLKLFYRNDKMAKGRPAAFGRLCVETAPATTASQLR